jgi:Ulp1 family protease
VAAIEQQEIKSIVDEIIRTIIDQCGLHMKVVDDDKTIVSNIKDAVLPQQSEINNTAIKSSKAVPPLKKYDNKTIIEIDLDDEDENNESDDENLMMMKKSVSEETDIELISNVTSLLNKDEKSLLNSLRKQYLTETIQNNQNAILLRNSLNNIKSAARLRSDKEKKIETTDIESLLNEKHFEDLIKNPTSIFNGSISFNVFSRLKKNIWLNDEINTAYSILLNKRETELRLLFPERLRIVYFDSIYLANLEKKHQFNESSKGTYAKSHIDKWDRIFIFANQNNFHWVLFEIIVAKKKIILYDSLYNNVSSYSKTQFDILIQFLTINKNDELTDVSNENDKTHWTKAYNSNCQLQRNDTDCGVYMFTFGIFLADFPAEFVKGLDMSVNGRIKAAMDITRGYIIDPRINNDKLPGKLLENTQSVFEFDYKQYRTDLSEENDIKHKEESNNNKIFDFKLKKNKLTIKSLSDELKIVKEKLRKLEGKLKSKKKNNDSKKIADEKEGKNNINNLLNR